MSKNLAHLKWLTVFSLAVVLLVDTVSFSISVIAFVKATGSINFNAVNLFSLMNKHTPQYSYIYYIPFVSEDKIRYLLVATISARSIYIKRKNYRLDTSQITAFIILAYALVIPPFLGICIACLVLSLEAREYAWKAITSEQGDYENLFQAVIGLLRSPVQVITWSIIALPAITTVLWLFYPDAPQIVFDNISGRNTTVDLVNTITYLLIAITLISTACIFALSVHYIWPCAIPRATESIALVFTTFAALAVLSSPVFPASPEMFFAITLYSVGILAAVCTMPGLLILIFFLVWYHEVRKTYLPFIKYFVFDLIRRTFTFWRILYGYGSLVIIIVALVSFNSLSLKNGYWILGTAASLAVGNFFIFYMLGGLVEQLMSEAFITCSRSIGITVTAGLAFVTLTILTLLLINPVELFHGFVSLSTELATFFEDLAHKYLMKNDKAEATLLPGRNKAHELQFRFVHRTIELAQNKKEDNTSTESVVAESKTSSECDDSVCTKEGILDLTSPMHSHIVQENPALKRFPTRVIDVETESLVSGYNREYAILSHRWLSEDVDLEILHGELQKAQKVSRVRNGPAKDKIVNILQVAKSHELQPETIWLDTCCIDKTNSTELNEALSCMGEWYAGASVCIAFLADSSATCLSEVENTEWATRGWTLQEIVMCTRVTFYNCYWEKIGDSMEDPIVDIRHLGRLGPKLLPCQGQKASKNPASTIFHGASTRRTTREEDEAYSLLGMLGISIPISYGEGRSRAMIRLINEVVTTTGDLSVFNWTGLDAGNKLPGKSLYPSSKAAFSPSLKAPVRSLNAIALGNSGVHTMFDIAPIVVIPLDVLRSHILEMLNIESQDIQCQMACILRIGGFDTVNEIAADDIKKTDVRTTIRCPLWKLKRRLETPEIWQNTPRWRAENGLDLVVGDWVLARFSGCEEMDWFLCEFELGIDGEYVAWRIPTEKIAADISLSNYTSAKMWVG